MSPRSKARLRTRYRVVEKTLVIDLGGFKRVLSSASQGGGFQSARYILNHQVEAHPVSRAHARSKRLIDPARYMRRLAMTLGVGEKPIGLMTAVPMKQLVTSCKRFGDTWVECFATVGVTNAVRAGEWPERENGGKQGTDAGTINLVLVTNACLSGAALVGAVQVVTESKTGVLRDHAVPSWTGESGATGTGTDVVVIACGLRGQGPWHRYSGTHTIIGAMIGRVVSDCVRRGLAREQRWRRSQGSLKK
ncbi:MAG TPA: adenosylcobinamide amidohydrolase [Nitrospira sp.]|nr:adenosylcobinamide amidohydrolase [Nitrospira sp.]